MLGSNSSSLCKGVEKLTGRYNLSTGPFRWKILEVACYVSGDIYPEYEEVIRRAKFSRTEAVIESALRAIRQNGFWVKPTEKDNAGGYPSLTSLGLVPLTELITNTTNCNSGTAMAGDQSQCLSPSGNPTFAQIQSGPSENTNTGPWIIGPNLTLAAAPGGTINATTINDTNWGSGASGGSLNTPNAVPVVFTSTVLSSNIQEVVVPNCTFTPTCALGFNQSTHAWNLNTVTLSATHPLVLLTCNGTNDACPSTPITGTGSAIILEQFTVAANTLSTDGQCFNTLIAWKHIVNSGPGVNVTYTWNVGGTGSVGGGVTGGNNAGNSTSLSTNAAYDILHVCRADSALMTYTNNEEWFFGGTNLSGAITSFAGIDWTQNQQINLLFSVANTDSVEFESGEVYYP